MRFRPDPGQVVRLLRQRTIQLAPTVPEGVLREPPPAPRSTAKTTLATCTPLVAAPVDACGACDVPADGHGVRYAAIPGHHVWVRPEISQREQRIRSHQLAKETPR